MRGRPAGVLVHCGAGVSRSAALCIAHLMQRHRWGATRALEHVTQRRAIVKPNDGFWRALCTLEAELGLAGRRVGSVQRHQTSGTRWLLASWNEGAAGV